MDRTPRATAVLLLCWSALVTAGCSSNAPPLFLQPCLNFAPDLSPGTVELRTNEPQTGCTVLTIDVRVSNVPNVFGAEFTFTYPVALMEFDEANLLNLADSFLDEDGLLLEAFADENDAGGEVTVVLTRDGSQSLDGVDAGDGDLLVSLLFLQAAGGGSGTIEFDPANADLLGPPAAPNMPPVPLGIDFTGGTITIQ